MVRPVTSRIGNITRPLKKSHGLPSLSFAKPSANKRSALYPASEAAGAHSVPRVWTITYFESLKRLSAETPAFEVAQSNGLPFFAVMELFG